MSLRYELEAQLRYAYLDIKDAYRDSGRSKVLSDLLYIIENAYLCMDEEIFLCGSVEMVFDFVDGYVMDNYSDESHIQKLLDARHALNKVMGMV